MEPTAVNGVSPWGGGVLHLQPSVPDTDPAGPVEATMQAQTDVYDVTRVTAVAGSAVGDEQRGIGGRLHHFRVRLSDETRRITVEILDPDSGEVLRQIPPEELERFIEAMYRHLGGLLDRRV